MSAGEASEGLKEHQSEAHAALLQQLIDQDDRAGAAWFRSGSVHSSGRWLRFRGGLANRFRMRDPLFVSALRRRCLLRPSPAEILIAEKACNCASHLQRHPTHLLDCPCNQWYYTRRHDTACGMLADLIRSALSDARIQREKEGPAA